LIQIDKEFNILDNVSTVVDLCAAPGSWSQVLSRRLVAGSEHSDVCPIVAVDLQEMAPIEGVQCYQGDITSERVIDTIVSYFGEEGSVDLVVSDGAPDVSGLHDLDELLQNQLLQAAFTITTRLLKPGGTFLAKVFCTERQVEEDDFLLLDFYRTVFSRVLLWKPHSSREGSAEHFLIAFDFHPEQLDSDRVRACIESGGGLA
jgi:tRNA (cytidine32/guanosine34-2'-O)-methyltransferase